MRSSKNFFGWLGFSPIIGKDSENKVVTKESAAVADVIPVPPMNLEISYQLGWSRDPSNKYITIGEGQGFHYELKLLSVDWPAVLATKEEFTTILRQGFKLGFVYF